MDTAPACFNGGMMHKHKWNIEGEYCASLEVVCYEQMNSGGSCGETMSPEEAERRLNCFDELVEAFGALLQEMLYSGGETNHDVIDAFRNARTALAAAKGEQSE
jgi:hypothetical protein